MQKKLLLALALAGAMLGVALLPAVNADRAANGTNAISWTTSAIDSAGDVGRWSSMARDTSGGLHIAYQDLTNHALKHAYNAGSTWSTETVDSNYAGGYCSLAIDTADTLHMSYFESITGIVKHAAKTLSGTWTTDVVDDVGTIGKWTSIATDSSNGVYVSYSDQQNAALMCAYNTSGSWQKETVDSGNVGTSTSTIVDSLKGVHIAYFSWSSQVRDLKYAYKPAGGSWTAVTVDSEGEVGNYTSITIDTANVLHISYFDGTKKDVKHAYKPVGSGAWKTESVDTVGDVGWGTSIKTDGANGIHVAYYDIKNHSLKYAYRSAGGTWECEYVDTNGIVGWYPSIAVDESGYVHISYYDKTNGDLKYATGKNPAIPEFVLPASILAMGILILATVVITRRKKD